MSGRSNEWQAWGHDDPYYGVLTGEEYRKENLTTARKDIFFASGAEHVRYVMARIAHHFGETRRGKALDYGCGVGRLVIPFAENYEEVFGIDLSDGMLAEARKVTAARGVSNVQFVQSDGSDLSSLPQDFDLVHSVIVFQHIATAHGYAIMENLLTKVAQGGIFALHVNLRRNAGWFRKAVHWARRFRAVHGLANIVTGKATAEPRMQMNSYSLDHIARLMHAHSFEAMIAEPYSEYQGYTAVFIFGRRNR